MASIRRRCAARTRHASVRVVIEQEAWEVDEVCMEGAGPALGRFAHRAAQPLACARLASETAALKLQGGDVAGAMERLLMVEKALDDVEAVLEEVRRAARLTESR